MKRICIANFAGGQGKTTVAVMLSQILAQSNELTLLIDADSQGNATSLVQVESSGLNTIMEVMRGDDLKKSIAPTRVDCLKCIAGDRRLIQANSYISTRAAPTVVLDKALAPLDDAGFEWCVIDSSPEGGRLSIAAVCAADILVIPVEVSGKGTEGLTKTLETLYELQDATVCRAEVAAVIPFRDRWVGQYQVIAYREHFETIARICQEEEIARTAAIHESADYRAALNEFRLPIYLEPLQQTVEAIVKTNR